MILARGSHEPPFTSDPIAGSVLFMLSLYRSGPENKRYVH
jgi:hypothetical protein